MSHYDLAIMNSAIRMAHGSLIRILHHSRIANKLGATAVQLPHEEVNKSRGNKELPHKSNFNGIIPHDYHDLDSSKFVGTLDKKSVVVGRGGDF